MRERSRRTSLYVSIVANNPETLHELKSYLAQAGVASHSTRALHDLEMVAPAVATATIIFPDDFPPGEPRALIHRLRKARPELLSLIITREPKRFRDVVAPDGRSLPPIVLPKPSFGWEILDAVRARAAESSPGGDP